MNGLLILLIGLALGFGFGVFTVAMLQSARDEEQD